VSVGFINHKFVQLRRSGRNGLVSAAPTGLSTYFKPHPHAHVWG
jgi:hypothetical protein